MSAKPKGVSKRMVFKMAIFFVDFLELDILVPVCFGTRLGASLAAPRGVSQRKGIKVASVSGFENLTFWYPFVLVPVWVPPTVGSQLLPRDIKMSCSAIWEDKECQGRQSLQCSGVFF